MDFIEIQQFGWNLVTFGFIGAMSTALIGFWGLIQQAQQIWQMRTSQSVPMSMHTYSILFFGADFFYGLHISSLALMIMGIRVILTLPVLAGILKFNGFLWWEWLMAVACLIMLVLFPFLPHMDVIYFVISLGATVSFIPQPVALACGPDRGAVSFGFLATIFVAVSFWTIYSFAIGNWVLMIINPLMLALVTLTIIIWFIKPPYQAGQS